MAKTRVYLDETDVFIFVSLASLTKQDWKTNLATNRDDGVLRKKIPIEDITRVLPNIPNYDEKTFALVILSKETILKCADEEEKISWLHAIETTKRGCFFEAESMLRRLDSSTNNNGVIPSPSFKAAPLASKVNTSNIKQPPAAPVGPYALLSKSVVLIKDSVDSNGKTDKPDFTLPAMPQDVSFGAPMDMSLELGFLNGLT